MVNKATTEKKETVPSCAKGGDGYSLSYSIENDVVKGLKITVKPLTLKALLKINEDLCTELIQTSNKLNARVGFLEGQLDAITLNQRQLNSSLTHLAERVYNLEFKPWWKRFLGL